MIKEKAAQLLSVKSIITLILSIVFAVLALTKAIDPKDVSDLFYIVIAFYFGTQYEKQNREGGNDV